MKNIEIDSTDSDVFVVDGSRDLAKGWPYMTIIHDEYSGEILWSKVGRRKFFRLHLLVTIIKLRFMRLWSRWQSTVEG